MRFRAAILMASVTHQLSLEENPSSLIIRAFSRALSSVTVSILISYWLITIALFALIGQCDDFSLASTTLSQRALQWRDMT